MNKKIGFVIGIIVVAVIVITLKREMIFQITPTQMKDWIDSFGILAPLVYMFIYTVRPLIFFPASVLSLAGGLVFGAWLGTIYTLIGATLGAALSFIVARKLGSPFGKGSKGKEDHSKWNQIKKNIEKHGFFYVLLLRFIPVINFDVISYLAGISTIRFSTFLLATFIGIIPGTFAYNFLGSSLTAGSDTYVVIAIVLVIIILIVPYVLKKKYNPEFRK